MNVEVCSRVIGVLTLVAARHQFLASLALVAVFGIDEVVTGTLGISRVLLYPVSVGSAVGTLSV